MHGLASLPAMLATWRARHPTLPLRAGPNAIAARSSPLGAQPTSDGTRRIALAAVDPRSGAQFGAAWALGHVAAWAYAGTGLQAISLMSLTGASGVVSWDGKVATRRPAFEVLAALGTPAEMCAVTVSDPQRIAALALMRAGQLTTHIANLGAAPVVVDVGGRTVRLDAYAVAALSTPTSTPTSTAADSRDAGT